ncbi:hypothetical protein [Arthrobacter parietis]|uniref:hypothetical protein n=1 Tax=Arthrobacter parietis TaxID=271434 RepID=UPI0031F9CDEB
MNWSVGELVGAFEYFDVVPHPLKEAFDKDGGLSEKLHASPALQQQWSPYVSKMTDAPCEKHAARGEHR